MALQMFSLRYAQFAEADRWHRTRAAFCYQPFRHYSERLNTERSHSVLGQGSWKAVTPQNEESSHHRTPSRPYQQQSIKSGRFDPLATSSRKQLRGSTHSKSVTAKDSSANLRSYEGTGHPDIVLQSLPSTSGAIEQSIGGTLQDAHHFGTGLLPSWYGCQANRILRS
ncbi:hypothetical protein M378DRAFT_579062 [Amanita muscaria Koide BX008]|uniref:Uncharacterized protein n=1 Tax=Amanita muscaria (strain Koide BX008) TaxID=946122 RepID=A0A0C2TCN5_AMAMK|nr:hypothetical protein M378DRAFT_579062 [Amanita muscaria Koide BX008]